MIHIPHDSSRPLPLLVTEALAYLNRRGYTVDDDIIERLIRSAMQHIEQRTQYVLTECEGIKYRADWHVDYAVQLQRAPVRAITRIEYKPEGSNTYTELVNTDNAYYELDDTCPLAVIRFRRDVELPVYDPYAIKPIRITLDMGYADGDLPYDLQQMVAALTVHMYVMRDNPIQERTTFVDRWIDSHTLATIA